METCSSPKRSDPLLGWHAIESWIVCDGCWHRVAKHDVADKLRESPADSIMRRLKNLRVSLNNRTQVLISGIWLLVLPLSLAPSSPWNIVVFYTPVNPYCSSLRKKSSHRKTVLILCHRDRIWRWSKVVFHTTKTSHCYQDCIEVWELTEVLTGRMMECSLCKKDTSDKIRINYTSISLVSLLPISQWPYEKSVDCRH